MAEKGHGLISSITARLRNYLKGRRGLLRRGERYDARLPFVITLLGTDRVSARFLRDVPALVGYTRDMSETGLTLLLPSVRAGDAYLTNVGSSLELKLDLPGGAVTMLTTSVRFEQLSRKEAGCGYLLAVSIVSKDAGREREAGRRAGAGRGRNCRAPRPGR